jgi:hypothetical protein
MTPEIKFTLHVSSSNPAQVWPINGKTEPELERRIEANYWADEDECCVSFRIADMDDLRMFMDFYREKTVTMRLVANIETNEWSAHAGISPRFQGAITGCHRAKEGAQLSPDAAAKKLDAIAHALAKWAEKNPLDRIGLPG